MEDSAVFIYQENFQKNNNFRSLFVCRYSKIELLQENVKYNITPPFFITNANVDITLDNCEINYGSNTLMIVSGTNYWGKIGLNDGNIYLKIINQVIHGNFIVDEISYLKIHLINQTIIGSFNQQIKKSGKIDIIIDPRSSLELTNESVINSIINIKSDNSNIKNYTQHEKPIRNISVKDEENEKDIEDNINTDLETNKETKKNDNDGIVIKKIIDNGDNFDGKNEILNSEKNKGVNLKSSEENSFNNGKYLINLSMLIILLILQVILQKFIIIQ